MVLPDDLAFLDATAQAEPVLRGRVNQLTG